MYNSTQNSKSLLRMYVSKAKLTFKPKDETIKGAICQYYFVYTYVSHSILWLHNFEANLSYLIIESKWMVWAMKVNKKLMVNTSLYQILHCSIVIGQAMYFFYLPKLIYVVYSREYTYINSLIHSAPWTIVLKANYLHTLTIFVRNNKLALNGIKYLYIHTYIVALCVTSVLVPLFVAHIV